MKTLDERMHEVEHPPNPHDYPANDLRRDQVLMELLTVYRELRKDYIAAIEELKFVRSELAQYEELLENLQGR
jgi:hypothetical protein